MAEKIRRRQGTLALTTGEELPLVGETDRFWVCENTRFRKCSPLVAAVTKTRRKKEDSDAHSE